jgi:hypothetical protein
MGKSADEKFWDLRNSGYDGPIDQDGNKAETGPLAEVLDALRRNT